jgi:hypothetical protein
MRMLGLLDPEDEGSRIRNYLLTAQHHMSQDLIFHNNAVHVYTYLKPV